MAKYEENKFVDYGGTALAVGSILVCGIFYPATVIAVHSLGIIRALGGGDYDFIIQMFVFGGVIGIIHGIMEAANEAETKIGKWFGILFLLLVFYVPTFMPFVRILQDIYK